MFPCMNPQLTPIDLLEIQDYNIDNAVVADLVADIAKHGLLQPLIVANSSDSLFVIDGTYRLLACRQLGFEVVPIVFIEER